MDEWMRWHNTSKSEEHPKFIHVDAAGIDRRTDALPGETPVKTGESAEVIVVMG
jgi:hypothetical protein